MEDRKKGQGAAQRLRESKRGTRRMGTVKYRMKKNSHALSVPNSITAIVCICVCNR